MLPIGVAICLVTGSEEAQMFNFSNVLNVPLTHEAQQEVIRRLDADDETTELTRQLKETSEKADLMAKADITSFALTGTITPECLESQLRTAELDEKIINLLLKRGRRAAAVIVKTKEDYMANGTLTPA